MEWSFGKRKVPSVIFWIGALQRESTLLYQALQFGKQLRQVWVNLFSNDWGSGWERPRGVARFDLSVLSLNNFNDTSFTFSLYKKVSLAISFSRAKLKR